MNAVNLIHVCVDCFQSDLDSGDTLSATYTVTLKSFPTIPHENNIHYHDGNPDINHIFCDTNDATGSNVYCNVTDSVSTNLVGKSQSF